MTDWEQWEDGPTTTYRKEPAIPLTVRRTSVPLAEGVRSRPFLEIEYRDLVFVLPWAISAGLICAHTHIHIVVAMGISVAIAVLYDRVVRNWI